MSTAMNSGDISLAYPPTPSSSLSSGISRKSPPSDSTCSFTAGLRKEGGWRYTFPLPFLPPGIEAAYHGSQVSCCCDGRQPGNATPYYEDLGRR